MKMVQEEHMMLGAGDQERERERLRHGPSPGLDQNGQRWRQAEDGLPVPAQSAPDSSLFQ